MKTTTTSNNASALHIECPECGHTCRVLPPAVNAACPKCTRVFTVPSISEIIACRDHWKTSFHHERENVIRLRKLLWDAHNSADPSVKPCKCYDCNAHATASIKQLPRASKAELEEWDKAMGHGQTDET